MKGFKCHLVHGYEVSDGGARTIDRLIPQLNYVGISVVQHDYGRFGIRAVLRKNKIIAKKVKAKLKPNDSAIGHSNGCAILVKALQKGAVIDKLILINPALDKHFEFPAGVNEIHVFHNKYDKAVVAAKWLRKLVFWRNTFLWGEMGNTGYKGDDNRVTNHVLGKGHSAPFNNRNIESFSIMITDIINGNSV